MHLLLADTERLHGVAGWMASLIGALGPIGVGIVIVIETVFPPIPSEVVLPGAGYLAGLGQLGWWSTLLWATVGSVVGAWLLYGAGALVGVDRLSRLATRVPLMSSSDVDRAWSTFDRRRDPVIFWGRLIPGIRSLVSLPAGAQRMGPVRFTLLTASGSIIWNGTLMATGWWLGDRYGATATVSHWLNITLLVATLVTVGWFASRRLRKRSGRTLDRPITPRATTRSRRRIAWIAGLVLIGAMAVAIAQPRIRRKIDDRFGDHIGAPPDGEAFDEFDPSMASTERFVVAGDVGTGDDTEQRTADAIDLVEGSAEYDALLLLGDNVYPAGDPAKLARTVFEPFATVLDGGTELLPVLGNHDVTDEHADAQARALGMPGRWYSKRMGDVLVVALDSTRPDDPEQVAWLESVLAADSSGWTIVMLHHPPYSAGYHGSSLDIRRIYEPIFQRYGVDLVLAGHDHDYQRSRPIGGVTYVVTGAAAETRPTGRADFTAVAWSINNFVDLEVYGDHIELRAIDQSGRVFDQATIRPNAGT